MRIVRYADDFVVMINGARVMPKHYGMRLQRCSLRWACDYRKRRRGSSTLTRGSTSSAGTSSAEADEGQNGKKALYTHPSKKALASVMDEVRSLTARAKHRTLGDLLNSLNRVQQGWCNYFRHGMSSRTFSYLDHFACDHFARWRVFGWLRKRTLG